MQLFPFDDDYLNKLRARDVQTEQHFVAYFNKLLLIKLRSRLRSSSAVEDIRQETFVRVFKTLRSEGGIRNSGGLGAFVNSVCNNVLLEFYRSSSNNTQDDERIAERPDLSIDLEGMLVTNQTRDRVREILGRLSEKERRLLRAIFFEERDKDEVCKDFGVDRDYLRVLLHRAKQNFRVIYMENQPDKGRRMEQ